MRPLRSTTGRTTCATGNGRRGHADTSISWVRAWVQPVSRPGPPNPVGQPFRTTDFVRQRSGPGTGYRSLGILAAGQRITVVCQVRSASVIKGTGIWDRLSDGSYVTDYYTSTPAFNRSTPGWSHC